MNNLIRLFKLTDGSEIVCEVVYTYDNHDFKVKNCMEVRKIISPIDPTRVIYSFTPWMAALKRDEPIVILGSGIIAISDNALDDEDKALYHSIVSSHFDSPSREPHQQDSDQKIDVGRLVFTNRTVH